ncbi:NAD(P)-dependent oxidoreductase [Leptolyngbya iicbica]|uniref:NAD(P)-dependent oxidoreductase n=2 Tax=Cyanophyceae TaxID=3028117 RepID=A0A4Q7E3W9_9CYAN|nr:NAD(P)-dependent oxidoreductase [Leptolyngbya sp. LK]RZM77396.1 NAD(P)-dependent oxidoreductase [Leptolyngbya sp. LK]
MKIGMIGTGLMGAPMALTLQQGGHTVVAYNRSADKLQPLAAQGIPTASTPAAVLAAGDCTILMLADAAAIAATLFTPETQAALSNHTIIQMGTIAPDQSRDLQAQLQAAQGHYLEAPVLGSLPQARDGSLILMVGSTPDEFTQWQPVFQTLGEQVLHIGPVGTGAAVKLAMNQLIGSLTTAFALSLALVQREQIPVETFMEIVRNSALYAPTFDKKLSRMCDRNFSNPNFPTKHLLKDMRLFAQAAEAAGLEPALADTVATVVQQAIAQGLADADYSALYAAVNPDS